MSVVLTTVLSTVLSATATVVLAALAAACAAALVLAACAGPLARRSRADAAGLVAPRGTRFGEIRPPAPAPDPATAPAPAVVRLPDRSQGGGRSAA